MGGQRQSKVGKILIAGAVEIIDKHYPGRIRLTRIPDTTGETLRKFVVDNTEPRTVAITDGNPAYLNIPDRTTVTKNLSA